MEWMMLMVHTACMKPMHAVCTINIILHGYTAEWEINNNKIIHVGVNKKEKRGRLGLGMRLHISTVLHDWWHIIISTQCTMVCLITYDVIAHWQWPKFHVYLECAPMILWRLLNITADISNSWELCKAQLSCTSITNFSLMPTGARQEQHQLFVCIQG